MSYGRSELDLSTLDIGKREILCRTYRDFDAWHAQSKAKAKNLDLWKYMRSERDGQDEQMVDVEPQPPASDPQAPEIPDDNAEGRVWEKFKRQTDVYNLKIQTYNFKAKQSEKHEKQKMIWKSYIERTIPRIYMSELVDLPDSLRDWWKHIVAKLAPQDDVRMALLANEHWKLMQGPKSEDIEMHFTKWIGLNAKLERHNHPLKTFIKNDFCRMFEDKVDLTCGRMAASRPSLEDAIIDCRSFIQRRPAKLRRANAAEVMTNHVDTYEKKEPNRPQNATNNNRKGCGNITGKPQDRECKNLGSCKIVNHLKRPPINEMSPIEKRQFESYKKYLKNNTRFLKIQCERFKDLVALDIQDECKAPKRRIVGELDDEDDILVNSTEVVFSHSARISSFEDDLLLDSGSNAHIINDPRIGSFKPRSIPHDLTIKTGNVELRAVVKGDLKIELKDESDTVELQLKNVLYVPNYHTNIVSDPQMRTRGLYLDGKTDIWYDKNDQRVTSL